MNAETITKVLTHTEFAIWLVVFVTALRARLHRRFPAILCFFGLRALISGGYSLEALYPWTPAQAHRIYNLYFDFYWVAYLLATLAVFLSIEQIIRRVLSPLPGLSRLGVIIFRFTGVLTFFIALTAHLSEMGSISLDLWLQAFFISFALCMCVFEVTLMSLLIATAQRLGLSFRTRIFGLSLGFCLLGLMDFLSLAVRHSETSRWAGAGLLNEITVFGTQVMWSVYLLLPDQRRGALMLKGSSPLMRWNEIVTQLGVGPQPPTDGKLSFINEVELIVAGILDRNQIKPI